MAETSSTLGLDSVDMETCGTSNGSGGAKKYKLVGVDGAVTLSTCGGQTSFDTKIRVYEVQGQENLVCVTGNDDACPNFHSSVSFQADPSKIYEVLVQ